VQWGIERGKKPNWIFLKETNFWRGGNNFTNKNETKNGYGLFYT